jgi:molybdenum cofactor cytidylyltransferase
LTGTAVAVLAAGRGSRVGGDTPKPLLELAGRPLVSWALDAAMGSGLRPVVLVVGHRARAVEAVAPQGVTVVRARGWRHGISRSLRAALGALEGWAQIGAVCVGLADQPRVGSEAYRRLAAAYDDGATLAVATYGGVRGNPVLIARSLWPEARRLDGDEGARVLMRTHPVIEVACDGTGLPDDVDTLEDLRTIEQGLQQEMES